MPGKTPSRDGYHYFKSMARELTAISLWDDTADTPTYNVGSGSLYEKDECVKLHLDLSAVRRAGLPDDIEGWQVLCSDTDSTVYEGTVTARHRRLTDRGKRVELRCEPSDLIG